MTVVSARSRAARLTFKGWPLRGAAKILGWTPRQVAYKMKKHGLSPPWKK